MNIYQAITTRKSVRAFTNQDVSQEVLTRILNAVRLAPSGRNAQEWRFVVVRNEATKQKLSQAAMGQASVAQAPVVLVCCAQTDEKLMPCGQPMYSIDVAIAMDHLTLCAVEEGLGTCWIGAFDEQQVKEAMGIPQQGVRVVEMMPLGYPKNPEPVAKNRLALEEIVKYEKW